MIKRYIKITFAILILVILITCIFIYKKSNTIDQRISKYIQNNCGDLASCKVTISDFTDFEWDTMCFVDSGATLEAYPKTVPASLPNKYSFMDAKIIFILSGQIVVFEEIPIGAENIETGTVLFDKNQCFYTQQEAVFNVKKIDNGLGGIYNLYKVSTATTTESN